MKIVNEQIIVLKENWIEFTTKIGQVIRLPADITGSVLMESLSPSQRLWYNKCKEDGVTPIHRVVERKIALPAIYRCDLCGKETDMDICGSCVRLKVV